MAGPSRAFSQKSPNSKTEAPPLLLHLSQVLLTNVTRERKTAIDTIFLIDFELQTLQNSFIPGYKSI